MKYLDERGIPMDSRNAKYSYGDWVMYCTNAGSEDAAETGMYNWEIGRIAEDMGAAARVCYHQGCTAALTQKDFLRPATKDEIDSHLATQRPSDPGIGYHRFDDSCPDMMLDACFACKHWNAVYLQEEAH